MKIKNRWDDSLIFEYEADNYIRLTVETAIKEKIDLRGSDLRGSNLRGSDLRDSNLRDSNLRGSNLRGSNLRGSNLSGADLRGSNLRGSNLRGSNLSGADLQVKHPSLNDHTLISEILWRSAINENEFNFAARVKFQLDKCWNYFIILAKKNGVDNWAKSVLLKWPEFEKKIPE